MSRSPTLTLLAVFGVVYLVELVAGVAGVPRTTFALAAPVAERPWALVTSVYAHSSLGHLLANAVALGLLGLVLEGRTSRARFHAFFLVSGSLSGLAQVAVAGAFGRPVAVLGASGGVFALLGYLLSGNRVAESVLEAVPFRPRTGLLLAALVAGGFAVATDGPGVALVAHFTGLFVGLVAGRTHLLRTRVAES